MKGSISWLSQAENTIKLSGEVVIDSDTFEDETSSPTVVFVRELMMVPAPIVPL